MSGPLRVRVADIWGHPGERRAVRTEVSMAELSVAGSRVPADRAVAVDVEVRAIPEGVVMSGRVAAEWLAPCRRCLTEAGGRLDIAVRELFETDPTEDSDSFPVDGDEADLEPAIRQAILVELPLSPVCRDDCQGLCAQCGADRNTVDCDCRIEVWDHRWDELSALSFDEPEEGHGP